MFNSVAEIELEYLKANHQMIHYFGLGFIQIKLTDEYRIHFYSEKLPSIMSGEEIHNHRYSFLSKILHGSLKQELFELGSGSEYSVEEESCKEGVKPESKPRLCNIKLMSTQNFTRNSSYTIDHNQFHRVDAKNAITLLKRGPYQKENAEVAKRVGDDSICPFSKKIPEDQLWEIVGRMLLAAKES